MAIRSLALYHLKGGVGKTATAVNLAYCAVRSGLYTLLVDLDPQGSATYYFRVKPKFKKGAGGLVRGGKTLAHNIKASDYTNLDILPADFSFRRLDRNLEERKTPRSRFGKVFQPLLNEYDLVIFDCPPGLTTVSENIFNLVDLLLLPVIPTTLSMHSLEQILGFLKKKKYHSAQVSAFFSMVERRKKLHRAMMLEGEKLPIDVLSSVIPYRSEVERMGLERRPVPEFAPNSSSAHAYLALWEELRRRYGVEK